MSRFVNLEFGDESGEQDQLGTPALKDEAFYLSQARVAFEAGKFELGLRMYAKVLEFNPNNAGAWTGQVRMLIELGEVREAKLWAEKALEKFPHDSELLASKAVALARCGDLDTALAFSDASIEERGDTPYIWLARGDVLSARSETRADYCFEKALLLARGDWFISWLAGRIRFYYKKFSLALKHFQQAVESNSSHFLLWIEMGRCQAALGLTTAARQSFAQAIELNPGAEEARREMSAVGSPGFFSSLKQRLFRS